MISLKVANNQDQHLNSIGFMSNYNKSSDLEHDQILLEYFLVSMHTFLVFCNIDLSLKFASNLFMGIDLCLFNFCKLLTLKHTN